MATLSPALLPAFADMVPATSFAKPVHQATNLSSQDVIAGDFKF